MPNRTVNASIETLKRIKELFPGTHLDVDVNDQWYVASPMYLCREGSGTVVGIAGRGETVDEAVETTWKMLTEIADDEYITVGTTKDNKWYWDGSAWNTRR